MASPEESRRKVRELIRLYEVPADEVSREREHFESSGGPLFRFAFATGWFSATLMQLAAAHRTECTLGGCQTCQWIAGQLAMVAAIQESMVDDDFARLARQLGEQTEQRVPPRRWWQRP